MNGETKLHFHLIRNYIESRKEDAIKKHVANIRFGLAEKHTLP